MLSLIIWLIGVICCIWCILDVFKKKSIGLGVKILIAILLIITSWLGLLIYYFIVRKQIS